jgi:hypothetical protein
MTGKSCSVQSQFFVGQKPRASDYFFLKKSNSTIFAVRASFDTQGISFFLVIPAEAGIQCFIWMPNRRPVWQPYHVLSDLSAACTAIMLAGEDARQPRVCRQISQTNRRGAPDGFGGIVYKSSPGQAFPAGFFLLTFLTI